MSAASPGEWRSAVLAAITERIAAVSPSHPLRVAIDGPDAAGKTTLADELADEIARRGRNVIRASIDGFHRPRADRYRQGDDSALGYYEDSFDYEQLAEVLLSPLGPGGSRLYRTRIFDYRNDSAARAPTLRAADDAVLLFDGVFLQRPDIVGSWDFRVYISVTFDEIIRRASRRDADLFGSADATETRYRSRYIPAQEHYLQVVQPQESADIVLANNDPRRPLILRG